MDKFGIFNLLNSFLNFSNNQTENKSEQNDTSANKNSPNLKDLLSPLSSLLNGEKKEQPSIKKERVTIPLQAGMLSTLKTHDEFIKRVKQNNKV